MSDSGSIASVSQTQVQDRPYVRGKFVFVGDQKLHLRGVTYGPFRPDEHGSEYHDPATVQRDFALMAANGINAVRTFTVPPRWLLDIALEQGLYVMVGLPWEQHIAFLGDRKLTRSIEDRVRAGVRACAGHPAVLCYTIGNEIPAPIVRWYGRQPVERFLKRLYDAVKHEDPGALVTYVNYPTTEYLQLPFVDLTCFNVYLESPERLVEYLAHLQTLANERPLILSEIGLDSRGHGEATQAAVLDWQIRTAFEAGCAGAFVFAWTDEWYRGGYDIEDWGFGLTRRDRGAKPGLEAVRDAYIRAPFSPDDSWPMISVVVCTYRGVRTIRECFEGLLKLDYPHMEVIVVNDGADETITAITQEYGFQLINTAHLGLSNARNVGAEAARGEIVAYTDDDAYPDPHWLYYLAATFRGGDYVGVGGPNLPPPDDGAIADCVAKSPGGPIHVLRSAREAEHIPGCNMAFRKDALLAVGGYDTRFRIAGDDVDLCWRLLQNGGTLGFSPSAVVWHHRRNSIKAYLRQQRNYGAAEAYLEEKWLEKFNRFGHVSWNGQLYGSPSDQASPFRRRRVNHGVWGSRPFQSIYHLGPSHAVSFMLMPEWYLVIAVLAVLSVLGIIWRPLLLALPLATLAAIPPVLQAVFAGFSTQFAADQHSRAEMLRQQALTALLHFLQPLARLIGRQRHGLTPWRRHGEPRLTASWMRKLGVWSEQWKSLETWIASIETGLRTHGTVVLRGGDFDSWDLQIRGGLFGDLYMRTTVEEHGGGKQLVRMRVWPRLSGSGQALILTALFLLGLTVISQAWLMTGLFAVATAILVLAAAVDWGTAADALASAFGTIGQEISAHERPAGSGFPATLRYVGQDGAER